MDHAHKGAKALESQNYAEAIAHYSAAIADHPRAPDYYIKRSAAHTRAAPPDYAQALHDAEAAIVLARERGKREPIGQAQLRRAVALFNLGRPADAKACLAWASKVLSGDGSIAIWQAKIDARLAEVPEGDERTQATVDEVPSVDLDGVLQQAAQGRAKPEGKSEAAPQAPQTTPASKIRHEWYQSADRVTVTLLAKGVPKDKATVDIQRGSLAISFPLPTGADYSFAVDPFYAAVDPAASSSKVLGTKVEVVLAKAQPGHKWHALEGSAPLADDEAREAESAQGSDAAQPASAQAASGPAYPTSSKRGAKDWDKLAADLTKKPGKEDGADEAVSDEEGDALNGFFKKLYKDADPDTRRAMVKSYQESNGTALSTNWGEVKKGRVDTSPPEGMVAKKWGDE